MKKIYSPNKKFRGEPGAFDRLEKAVDQAVARDETLRIEYEKEKINLQIAAAVNKLRTEAGLTQTQLAEKAGLTQPFVARLENPTAGKKPTLDTLAKVFGAVDKRIRIEIV